MAVLPSTSMALEILDGLFVLSGFAARSESAEITAAAGLSVLFAGIQPVLSGG
jgi:hypothetical protein